MYDGHRYNKKDHRTGKDGVVTCYWICNLSTSISEITNKKVKVCGGAMNTYIDDDGVHRIKKAPTNHDCDRNANDEKKEEIRRKVRQEAIHSSDLPLRIIQEVKSQLTIVEQENIPKDTALTRQIQRVQKKNKAKEPKNLANLEIPEFKKWNPSSTATTFVPTSSLVSGGSN